jgi:hypothetical protein
VGKLDESYEIGRSVKTRAFLLIN